MHRIRIDRGKLIGQHAVLPEPVQRELATSPAMAGILAANPTLADPVRVTLARTADPAALLDLILCCPPTLAALPACLDRLAAILEQEGAAGTVVFFDDRVSDALLSAPRAEAAAAVAAAGERLPIGPETAATLLALGGPVAPLAVATAATCTDRLLWLAGPGGRQLGDDEAWAVLNAPGAPARAGNRLDVADLSAAVLLQRPALRARRSDHPPVLEAQAMLARAEVVAEEIAATGQLLTDWLAERAPDALVAPQARLSVLPWVLAVASGWGWWPPEQRRDLASAVEHWLVRDRLGQLAPQVAQAFGTELPLGAEAAAATSWEARVRHAFPPGSMTLVDEPGPVVDGATPVPSLYLAHGAPAAAVLAGLLADEDPAVEAARWRSALALATDFTGTLAELAAVASGVAD